MVEFIGKLVKQYRSGKWFTFNIIDPTIITKKGSEETKGEIMIRFDDRVSAKLKQSLLKKYLGNYFDKKTIIIKIE